MDLIPVGLTTYRVAIIEFSLHHNCNERRFYLRWQDIRMTSHFLGLYIYGPKIETVYFDQGVNTHSSQTYTYAPNYRKMLDLNMFSFKHTFFRFLPAI